MDKLVIHGGRGPLRGTVAASGAKNAVLPLMAAALLAEGKTTIRNTPDLQDVYTLNHLLRVIGAKVEFKADSHDLLIDAYGASFAEAPYDLVKKMRASIYVLGPLLARFGHGKVSLPGGCAWGPRPVNLHLEGFQALGAEIELDEGYIIAKAPSGGLRGGKIKFEPSSVGATGNVLMAAVLAKGSSRIENAAMEPEITALADCLVKMGARIDGIGTSTLEIEGVDRLNPITFTNIPDRIEAGTFLVAGAMIPGSEVTVTDVRPDHLTAVTDALRQAGATVTIGDRRVTVAAPDELRPVDCTTEIYPGFPTDMQAQWMTLMTQATGGSTITDTIYADRFKHVPELERLGAHLTVEGNHALVRGADRLKGATVMSTDLRASVSLVMAGLLAEGRTEVLRVYHLDRGYEAVERKFATLGADVVREHYDEFT